MTERWDTLIVGAGPAGCAAAYDLAAAGRSVLLLDKADFPRPKTCAGGLTRKSLKALRYSVAPIVRTMISSIVLERQGGDAAMLPSRSSVCSLTVRQELDAFCLKQTLMAGARFARVGTIAGVEESADEVVIRTGERSFQGRFLIGADGANSRVRQLVAGGHPAWLRFGFALEAEVRPRGGSDSDLIFDLAPVRGGYGWVFPKRDHLSVGLYTESREQKQNRQGLAAYISQRFSDAWVGTITGQYLGFGAEDAPPRRGRIFLVGDAGGFADPLTGEGIYGAIASGQAAAAAIDVHLRSGVAADGAFAERTAQLRQDLRLSVSGARWFYSNPDLGFRALTAPMFRGAVINAYANGTKIAALANAVRRFAQMFATTA